MKIQIELQPRNLKCIRCGGEIVTQALIMDGIELLSNARLVCNTCSTAEAEAGKQAEWKKICPFRFRDTEWK